MVKLSLAIFLANHLYQPTNTYHISTNVVKAIVVCCYDTLRDFLNLPVQSYQSFYWDIHLVWTSMCSINPLHADTDVWPQTYFGKNGNCQTMVIIWADVSRNPCWPHWRINGCSIKVESVAGRGCLLNAVADFNPLSFFPSMLRHESRLHT